MQRRFEDDIGLNLDIFEMLSPFLRVQLVLPLWIWYKESCSYKIWTVFNDKQMCRSPKAAPASAAVAATAAINRRAAKGYVC